MMTPMFLAAFGPLVASNQSDKLLISDDPQERLLTQYHCQDHKGKYLANNEWQKISLGIQVIRENARKSKCKKLAIESGKNWMLIKIKKRFGLSKWQCYHSDVAPTVDSFKGSKGHAGCGIKKKNVEWKADMSNCPDSAPEIRCYDKGATNYVDKSYCQYVRVPRNLTTLSCPVEWKADNSNCPDSDPERKCYDKANKNFINESYCQDLPKSKSRLRCPVCDSQQEYEELDGKCVAQFLCDFTDCGEDQNLGYCDQGLCICHEQEYAFDFNCKPTGE